MLRLPHLSKLCLKACFFFFSRLSDYAEEKTEKQNTEICGQKKNSKFFRGSRNLPASRGHVGGRRAYALRLPYFL